jgi:hypothetical protein
MAAIDLDKMLDKVKHSQWALADIDWDAPGAELVHNENWPKLKTFMADLMWIEHVGARGFASMAKNAPTATLREMYTWFHAEEQRHANAEMALMKRWGMLESDKIPEPNINLRLVIEWVDKYGDTLPFYTLGAVIPMLEIALDGALCKFLLDTVEDPLCHQVFEKINADESRHLGVGFTVMEQQGYGKSAIQLMQMMGPLIDPRMLLGILAYLPLLSRMRDNLIDLGLSEEKLYAAIKKFGQIGGRTREGRRNPWYQLIKRHGNWAINRNNYLYHMPVDALVRLSDFVPPQLLGSLPAWIRYLTPEPYDKAA